jgi:hypothetical protein
MSERGSVFSQFLQNPPKPEQHAKEPSPAQRLLDFLQRWPKDTISAREITLFGPRIIRAQRSEINTAEALVKHGWLTPSRGRARNCRQFRVVRRPLVHPTVDA